MIYSTKSLENELKMLSCLNRVQDTKLSGQDHFKRQNGRRQNFFDLRRVDDCLAQYRDLDYLNEPNYGSNKNPEKI